MPPPAALRVRYIGVCSAGTPATSASASAPLVQGARVIVSHAPEGAAAAAAIEGVLAQIWASPGWAAVLDEGKTRLELKSGLDIFCIELDSACRAFIVVVTEGFPTRFIFSVGGGLGSATSATPPLLAALQNAVRATLGETPPPPPPPAAGKSRRGGAATPANRPPTAAAVAESARLLKRAMKASTLKALAVRYSDIDSLDKLAAATRKVEELKAAVARNINKATERDILLDDIEHKSVSIRESAKTMFVASTRVADTVRCRRYILLLSVTLCILVVAAVLIVIINYSATPHPLWA